MNEKEVIHFFKKYKDSPLIHGFPVALDINQIGFFFIDVYKIATAHVHLFEVHL